MFLPVYVPLFVAYNYAKTGHWPQVLQGTNWLYRKGNYGVQHHANANPDNFWDKQFYCWTSDPSCGIDIGPKRPWLDLKNPEKNLEKFHRDPLVNQRTVRNGFGGF